MTRRRKKQRSISHRDTYAIASSKLVGLYNPIKYTELPAIEDRRRFHPDGAKRQAKSITSSSHRIIRPSVRRKSRYVTQPQNLKFQELFTEPKMLFEDPETLICVRRKTRKEVLFAKNKAGRRGQKPKKFSQYSSVSCKKRS